MKGFRDCHWAPEGVAIRNPAFDVTPAELVTALVTEKGIVTNDTLMKGGLSGFVKNGRAINTGQTNTGSGSSRMAKRSKTSFSIAFARVAMSAPLARP